MKHLIDRILRLAFEDDATFRGCSKCSLGSAEKKRLAESERVLLTTTQLHAERHAAQGRLPPRAQTS